MLTQRKIYKLKEKGLKDRIYSTVNDANYQVIEYQWYIKTFGNIYLKISNKKEEHTFILDRDEYIIDNKPAVLSFNNKEIVGFSTRQIYFVLMLEEFLRNNK